MNSANKINELAEEYIQFQNLDKDKLDFKDHIQMYESLNQKLDEAGISFYDLGLYVSTRSKSSK